MMMALTKISGGAFLRKYLTASRCLLSSKMFHQALNMLHPQKSLCMSLTFFDVMKKNVEKNTHLIPHQAKVLAKCRRQRD